MELSRRDDLESLGYMLIYFFTGDLDWQKIEENDTHTGICHLKEEIVINTEVPRILLYFIKYVRGLRFEEDPDYLVLINEFKREISLENEK
jgi:hypothetical protein